MRSTRSATAPGSGSGRLNSGRAAPSLPGSHSGFKRIIFGLVRPDRPIRRDSSVPDSAPTLSIIALFIHADVVVKGVLLLLLAASVWSWAVIIDKLWRLAVASRSARAHEVRVAAAHSAPELMAPSGRSDGSDPAGQVLSAGWIESTEAAWPAPETLTERRERIERAMRLALNSELRRLEARLPFLATLGSAAPFLGP